MRIVGMGSGGTGGYFGAKLARAGEDVTFVARGKHLEAIRAQGLRVRSAIDGEWTVTAAPGGRLGGVAAAGPRAFLRRGPSSTPAGGPPSRRRSPATSCGRSGKSTS